MITIFFEKNLLCPEAHGRKMFHLANIFIHVLIISILIYMIKACRSLGFACKEGTETKETQVHYRLIMHFLKVMFLFNVTLTVCDRKEKEIEQTAPFSS